MTELEWLKQESGMTDAELETYNSFLGNAKFKTMLAKLVAAKDQATADAAKAAEERTAAEQERLNLETQYNDVYLPEIRRTTQDALAAAGETARLKAQLEKAKEYGLVIDDPAPVRAPGSPDPTPAPAGVSREEIDKISSMAASGLATMNDLNAEHFKLFGTPVPDMSGLLAAVDRERKMGHQTDIRQVWEKAHNVSAKRAELTAAEQKKHDDSVRESALKEYREKHGDNANLRTGQPSRFSTYSPSDGSSNEMPWKKPHGMARSNNSSWREKATQKLAVA
jgi:hypothetical protein